MIEPPPTRPTELNVRPWPHMPERNHDMPRRLVFVDTETTGLNPFVHQAYEVAWAIDPDPDIYTCVLPHTLENADPFSLDVGGYWDRGFSPTTYQHSFMHQLRRDLKGATLVAANPSFDHGFLWRSLGVMSWHHRLLDVEVYAMAVLRLEQVPGLAEVREKLNEMGHDIPEPDHSAVGDVATLRACFHALRGYAA